MIENPRRISKATQKTVERIRADARKPLADETAQHFAPAEWIDVDAVAEEYRPLKNEKKVSFVPRSAKKEPRPRVLKGDRIALGGSTYRPEAPIDTNTDVSGSMADEVGQQLRQTMPQTSEFIDLVPKRDLPPEPIAPIGVTDTLSNPGHWERNHARSKASQWGTYAPETWREKQEMMNRLVAQTEAASRLETDTAHRDTTGDTAEPVEGWAAWNAMHDASGKPLTRENALPTKPKKESATEWDAWQAMNDEESRRMVVANAAPTTASEPVDASKMILPVEIGSPHDESLEVPEEEVAYHNGVLSSATKAEQQPLRDDTPVVGEDIPYLAAAAALRERKATLDTEAEAMGEKEASCVRAWGEKYNRLDLKWKIALGATLGGAAAAGMAFGSPIALIAGALGTAGQRVAAGLGMFVKAENYLQHKDAKSQKDTPEWQRQLKAASLALAYTGLSAFGIKKAIDAAGSWLEHVWPSAHSIDTHSVMSGHPAITDPHEIMSAAPINETHIPTITVEATPGHGYEYMTKQLWQQLKEKRLDPGRYPADSDLHKLLTADARTIDKVVHQIASDPKHGFFHADGTSTRIDLKGHLSFGKGGELHFGDTHHMDVITSPEGAPVTPPYHPEAGDAVHHATAPTMPQVEGEHTAILNTDGTISGSNGQIDPMNAPYTPSEKPRGFFATLRRIFRGAPPPPPTAAEVFPDTINPQ